MKITEPKTPYAKQYDPAEDDDLEDTEMLNADELKVDELDDIVKKRTARTDDIPDFDLGEPEIGAAGKPTTPEGEKRVIVEPDAHGEDMGHHGEEWLHMTPEEQEKHRKFEEMRKKHYEMKNVKGLLG